MIFFQLLENFKISEAGQKDSIVALLDSTDKMSEQKGK